MRRVCRQFQFSLLQHLLGRSKTHLDSFLGARVLLQWLTFCRSFLNADGTVIVAKTGMGSSAALVSSLVGALLSFFGAARLPCFDDVLHQEPVGDGSVHGENESLDLTHNLAQACHCVAQGKVNRLQL